MNESIRKADILIEALPYLRAFRGKAMVVKYGGSAIDNVVAMRGILQDLVFLSTAGIHATLVHGGGPMITRRLAASGGSSAFIDGMRVTDDHTIRIVAQELETVNRRLVAQVKGLGGHAVGLGPRHRVVLATPHPEAHRLGWVGRVKAVRATVFRDCFSRSIIPILSPIGVGSGHRYNINADDVASAVATSIGAEKLVLLTNVRGILTDPNNARSLISTLTVKAAHKLMARHVIQEGMIPKVKACIGALSGGVKKTHVIDASIPHALLLEIFTKQGIGTEILHG